MNKAVKSLDPVHEDAMSLQDLPALNAALNSLAFILLLIGYRFIKRGQKKAHRNTMVSATVVSSLFLTSYLTYHFHFGHKVFPELGWIKTLYLSILIPHILLAVLILPLILLTFFWAFKGNWAKHRAIARITFPLWIFVSVTGVVIYFFLKLFYL
ncbi:MAG: DUF420 domain-containing protein [Bacteriovoracales bacterium]|nr:DUF420 domain-containing protein [Bacteriovoracales bacterium]